MKRRVGVKFILLAVIAAACGPSATDPGTDTGPTLSTSSDATATTIAEATIGEATVGELPASIEVFADYPRYLWHKRRLSVATTNGTTEPLTITMIRLHSDHFEPVPVENKRTVIPAGSRVDVQADFGDLVSCDPGPRQASVEYELAIGDGPTRTVIGDLDPTPLDEMLDRECAAIRIAEAVDIGFGSDWARSGDDLIGTISITRRGADLTRVEAIRGTEIFAMVETSDPPLLPLDVDGDIGVPIELFVTRCDPHVVGQSTRTFEFKIWVGLGGEKPRLAVIDPDPELMDRLTALLAECIANQ